MDLQKRVSVDCFAAAGNGVTLIDRDQCGRCDKSCLYVCPAGLFSEQDGEVSFEANGLCLECGACRLVCPNISFDYPGAGGGIIHKFG